MTRFQSRSSIVTARVLRSWKLSISSHSRIISFFTKSFNSVQYISVKALLFHSVIGAYSSNLAVYSEAEDVCRRPWITRTAYSLSLVVPKARRTRSRNLAKSPNMPVLSLFSSRNALRWGCAYFATRPRMKLVAKTVRRPLSSVVPLS